MKMREKSFGKRLLRLLTLKLIVPLKRSPHPPEYTARGVLVGMMWAMTPLVGIQMWLVFMTWVIWKRFSPSAFSLTLGLAWTWVTNVFTMVPAYYVFYVTGQLMMGNFDSIGGYDSLQSIIAETFLAEYTFLEKWGLFFKLLLKDWGVSMAVGCLPWAIAGYVGGYYFTCAFEKARLKRRMLKMAKKGLFDGTSM
jgi:uncharacterized protein (DUF2062 family)